MNIEEIEGAKMDVLTVLKNDDIDILKIFLNYDKRMYKILWMEFLSEKYKMTPTKIIEQKIKIRKFGKMIDEKIIAIDYYKHH
jgi:hypothetical protein